MGGFRAWPRGLRPPLFVRYFVFERILSKKSSIYSWQVSRSPLSEFSGCTLMPTCLDYPEHISCSPI